MTAPKPESVDSTPDIDAQIAEWDNPRLAPDTLNRTAFAERIVTALMNWKSRESLIVGLYGPWGSGKTWLLNKIVENEHLRNDSDFKVCLFNPWQFESNEQITAELFDLVHQQLEPLARGKKTGAKERAALWAQLGQMTTFAQIGITGGKLLAGAPTIPPAALGAVGKLLRIGEKQAKKDSEPESLSSVREALVRSFSEASAPKILVVVDDLDRLANDQIQMIFRLIKVSANFPNIHYLILGERNQLAKALDPICSGEGDRYLEKIVQIPMTIPEPDPSTIKGRLWEGITLIAHKYNCDSERHLGRFDSFWRSFLKEKLTTPRAVYRLLSLTHFHAASLFQDGELEVDLLDLIAVDFLRIHSPTTYNDLVSSRFGEIWLLENRMLTADSKNKQDSPVACEILKRSELGELVAFRAIAHLFPDFSNLIPDLLNSRGGYFNDHRRHKLKAIDRPFWNEAIQPLYFQLTPDASRLPAAEYLRFKATDDAVAQVKILKEWKSNGWRPQLISRLIDDSDFVASRYDPYNFLLALSSVSDELDSDRDGPLGSELAMASRLWLERFSAVPEGKRLEIIERIFSESAGVSIPLLILEYLRDKNELNFHDREEAPRQIPEASKEAVEGLSEVLYPEVKKRFWRRFFPVSPNEANRLYRLAHALGPKRTEQILTLNQNDFDEEACYAVVLMVMRSLSPRVRLDLYEESSVIEEASKNVFSELLRFACSEFWLRFAESARIDETSNPEMKVALLHIITGKDAKESSDTA